VDSLHTLEALWMGIWVVTMAGDRPPGRVGVSLVSQVDLARLAAARDTDDYVRAAVA
jgi:predicted O-linked N-acetylglucosamine transferase (SPINDLY family)